MAATQRDPPGRRIDLSREVVGSAHRTGSLGWWNRSGRLNALTGSNRWRVPSSPAILPMTARC